MVAMHAYGGDTHGYGVAWAWGDCGRALHLRPYIGNPVTHSIMTGGVSEGLPECPHAMVLLILVH